MQSSSTLDVAMLEERAEEVSRLLALMANPKRLLILCRLLEGDMTVGALAEAVALSQSALSQHLAKLREAGFYEEWKKTYGEEAWSILESAVGRTL